MTRNPVEVDRRIGRPANRRVYHNRIFERGSGHNITRAQILPHHLDDAPAGFIADLATLAVGSGNCR